MTLLGDESDPSVIKRALHTLKGNAAVFGLRWVSEHCHRIEERIAQDGGGPSAHELAELGGLWRSRLQSIGEFVTNLGNDSLEVQPDEHRALVESLLGRRDYDEILNSVEEWSWSRTSERLAHMRAQVEYVAQRLDKDINVHIEHNDIRIPQGYLDQVWSNLVHAVRNAVDHGIETSEVRQSKGKPRWGTISLSTRVDEASLYIQISDDGAGIDAGALRRAAGLKGIAADSVPVEQLVFVEGLSSRSNATDVSGRGVGLAALRVACEEAGGSIQAASEPGVGTRFTLRFPRPVVKRGALAAKLERRWSLVPAATVSTSGVQSTALSA